MTASIVLLAVFRPTSPRQIVNEIRLAAGFDRYQAALDEGDRLYSSASAELELATEDPAALISAYARFERARERYEAARREADSHAEDVRAQERLAAMYDLWGRALLRQGTGAWYERNDRSVLDEAGAVVDAALALPAIADVQRRRLEDLAKRIHRATTPWPIL